MPAFDSDLDADRRYCDSCRLVALKAFKILEDVLLPYARDLEDIGTYRYSGKDVDTSQVTDISLLKRRRIVVQDSSDNE
jgi:hypothetical protein